MRTLRCLLPALLLSLGFVSVVAAADREPVIAPRPQVSREPVIAPRPVENVELVAREALEAPRPELPVVDGQPEITATLELPVGVDQPQAREIPPAPYSPEPPLPVFQLETHLAPLTSHENTVESDVELLPAPPAEENTRASRPVQTLGGLVAAAR